MIWVVFAVLEGCRWIRIQNVEFANDFASVANYSGGPAHAPTRISRSRYKRNVKVWRSYTLIWQTQKYYCVCGDVTQLWALAKVQREHIMFIFDYMSIPRRIMFAEFGQQHARTETSAYPSDAFRTTNLDPLTISHRHFTNKLRINQTTHKSRCKFAGVDMILWSTNKRLQLHQSLEHICHPGNNICAVFLIRVSGHSDIQQS